MNKAMKLVLLILSIAYINGEFGACEDSGSYGQGVELYADFCRIRTTEMDYTHCCYVKIDDVESCKQITDDEFDNIKRYKKYLKNDHEKVKIKCSSQYLSLSFLALLALLI